MSIRRRKIAQRVLRSDWLMERVMEYATRLSRYLRYITRKDTPPDPELDA